MSLLAPGRFLDQNMTAILSENNSVILYTPARECTATDVR